MKKKSKESLINNFKIFTDNREQNPWTYAGYTIFGTLSYGDYTIFHNGKIYSDQIIIERKGAVSEIFQASGKERERFEKELEKMKDAPHKYILCEFDFMEATNNPPPGVMSITSVYGSICKWMVFYNIPFIFCGNRRNARAVCFKLLQEYFEHKILNL